MVSFQTFERPVRVLLICRICKRLPDALSRRWIEPGEVPFCWRDDDNVKGFHRRSRSLIASSRGLNFPAFIGSSPNF
jgi:hypothetical protein